MWEDPLPPWPDIGPDEEEGPYRLIFDISGVGYIFKDLPILCLNALNLLMLLSD